MGGTLTLDLKTATLRGVIDGRLVLAPVHADAARVLTWEKTQELRSGRIGVTSYAFQLPRRDGKGYVLTSVQHKAQTIEGGARAGPAGHRLTIAESGALEVYDYPGAYAGRFDGVDPAAAVPADPRKTPTPGGPVPLPYPNFSAGPAGPGAAGMGPVVAIRGAPHPGLVDGGVIFIHGWPPRNLAPAIVVLAGFEAVLQALAQTRQVSIVVEF